MNNNPLALLLKAIHADERTKLTQDHLWSAYRLGMQSGMNRMRNAQILTPTCPLHVGVPLWTEMEPKSDGSWLYCIFCRQNQFARETEHMRPVKHVPGLHRNKLTPPTDEWLNSDTSEQPTVHIASVGTHTRILHTGKETVS